MARINLGISRVLALILAAAHAAALAMVWLADLPWMVKIAVVPVFLGSLVFSIRLHAWRLAPSAVISLELDDECPVVFQLRDGRELEGELLGSSFVAPWLTVLNLRPAGRWRACHVVILPDAVDREAFRKLRVLLRWKCAQAKPG
jgi:toxin CptA